ncbi:MAG: zf-HC2 domain-containing protein [Deltaproteobacteria bacterium]|nr:zf-HC2 domain-containing protein [Candidatus Zymogenaceae bacterium]
MRCKQAKKLFSEYLLGDISQRHRVLLEEHIESCSSCDESLSVYRELFNHFPDSSINDPSELYFDVLPGKVLSRICSGEDDSRDILFFPFRRWWKPASVLMTAVLVVLVFFLTLPGGTNTPTGSLPDLTDIDQIETYTEFISSVEHTDETLMLDNFETAINGASDNDIWYSDTDAVDSMLLFSDEEQEEIFNEIKERMS